MEKSEVSPFTPKTASSSSDSDSADEAMEMPVCDETTCPTGEDESRATNDGRSAGEDAGRSVQRKKWQRNSPRGRGMYPTMAMIRMRGLSPPIMMPVIHEKPRRCHRTYRIHSGLWSLVQGPCGPKFGLYEGRPCMRRRFMRHMLYNTKFFQRIHGRCTEDGSHSEHTLAADFSKMNVSSDKEEGKGSTQRHRMIHRGKRFSQMAKQMGWTSESPDGASDGEAIPNGEKKEEKKERRKAERQRMRKIMNEMRGRP